MHIQQFNNEGCLSYLVYCPKAKEAVIIDPTNPIEKYKNVIEEKALNVKYIIETHTHADHASTAKEVAELFNAKIAMHENIKKRHQVQIPTNIPESIVKIIKYNSKIPIDILVNDDTKLELGEADIHFHTTLGHTMDGMCVQIEHLLFTGDTLFIGQCGRVDLPGGSAQDLYDSLFETLNKLSDDLVIYPAHDYEGEVNSALGFERVNNPFLQKRSKEAFLKFTGQFFPPLEEGDGGKLQCALTKDSNALLKAEQPSSLMNQLCFHMEKYLRTAPSDWNAISNEELYELLNSDKKLLLIDVREPEELKNLGHIKGAINIPLQQLPDNLHRFPTNKEELIVVACHSGNRSAYGALYIRGYGYVNVKNLEYGMVGWLKNNYPIEKERMEQLI